MRPIEDNEQDTHFDTHQKGGGKEKEEEVTDKDRIVLVQSTLNKTS